MLFQLFLVAHVALATIGYGGLIAIDVWLWVVSRLHKPEALIEGIDVWRRLAALFGPLAGIGVLAGFALTVVARVPLASAWLVGAYIAVIVVLLTQASIMIPWQIRARAVLAHGEWISTGAIAVTLGVFAAGYIVILSLMLLR
jgi:hypothetical protein